MNNGHIRRLHFWLESTRTMPSTAGDDTQKTVNRKHYLPLVQEMIMQNVGQPDDVHIKVPVTFNGIEYGEGDIDFLQLALNKVEQECFGCPISRLLLGGYYPGNYMSKCAYCENLFIGQKRGITCMPCATVKELAIS